MFIIGFCICILAAKHVQRPRGRPILRRVAASTAKNRLAALRKECGVPNCNCVYHLYKRKYGSEPPKRVPHSMAPHSMATGEEQVRRRAAPATHATLVACVLAKASEGLPWREVKKIKHKKAVYKDAVIKMQANILKEIPIEKTSRGAFVNPATTIPIFLQLASAPGVCHGGKELGYTPSLNLFCDATKMAPYGKEKVHVLSIGLPHAKQPHALEMQLCLGRWIGNEGALDFWAQFLRIGLITALAVALSTPFRGVKPRLTIVADWAFLVSLLSHHPVGHRYACICCRSLKEHWMYARYPKGAPLFLSHFSTALRPLLDLLESHLDVIYDPLHAVALVLRHMICHAVWLWMAKHCPNDVGRLSTIFMEHVEDWKAPQEEAPQKDEFSIAGIAAKALIANDKFWSDLLKVMPHVTISCVALNNGQPVTDGFQKFLPLVRRLCRQLLSWCPERVEDRDQDCAYMHALYTGLDLSPKRVTVNCHYFMEHYTARLLRHGNLVGLCSEGGEHQHCVHRDIVVHHKQYARYVCPRGIFEVMRSEVTKLWAWLHGYKMPSTHFNFDRPPRLAPPRGIHCPT